MITNQKTTMLFKVCAICVKFAVPFLLGIVVSTGLIHDLQSKEHCECNEPQADPSQRLPAVDRNSVGDQDRHETGWYPIHVYYGKNDALKTGRAQLEQDKIVSKLVSMYKLSPKAIVTQSAPYFVDVGANNAVSLSNTFLLESEGWQGLCIEPNHRYWYDLAARRNCVIAAAFVGAELQPVNVSLTNAGYGGIVGYDNRVNQNRKDERRFTISMKSLFCKFNVPEIIHYMSLDVEGAEELVMRHFPFDKYIILFVTIERPKPGLQTLLNDHGYHFVMKLAHWGETLWVHEKALEAIDLASIQNVVYDISRHVKRPT